ncbi:MAG TPA: PqqD family protein [Gemmatimonadaceae bacterium]|nr:PqqD family protein [Gemmatimonadaceae bacterium]
MTRYRVSEHALSAVLQEGTVLLHLHTKRYYTLNETGAAVWELIEQGVSREEMVPRLTETFDVDPATAETEVDRLVRELSAELLISVEEG